MPDPVRTLAGLFAGLEEIAQGVLAVDLGDDFGTLSIYQARPHQILLPAIWFWLAPGVTTVADTYVEEDEIYVRAIAGVQHGDAKDQAQRLFKLADALRNVLGRELKNANSPLGGVDARVTAVQPGEHDFNGTPVLAVEFPIRVRLQSAHAAQF